LQNKKTIKAVIWDLDGTILDTTELILGSYRYSFRKVLDRDIADEEALGNFGITLKDIMTGYSPEKAGELIEAYREYNHAHHDELVSVFPGILDALANIHRRGFPQAVVTSKTEWLTCHGLELFGLDGFIDTIVGFESTEIHKPNPEPLLEALKKLEIEADEAIFIGDSRADVECAISAEVAFVAAMWGPNPVFMAECHAWRRIEDPRDLLLILPRKGPKKII